MGGLGLLRAARGLRQQQSLLRGERGIQAGRGRGQRHFHIHKQHIPGVGAGLQHIQTMAQGVLHEHSPGTDRSASAGVQYPDEPVRLGRLVRVRAHPPAKGRGALLPAAGVVVLCSLSLRGAEVCAGTLDIQIG